MNRGRIGAGALSAAMATFAFANTAGAQEAKNGFGERGQWVIGADRLVPLVSYQSETTPGAVDPVNGTITTNRTYGGTVSLLWGQANNAPNFYTVPRLGLDYFLTDMLSLGLEVGGAFSTGGSNEATTTDGSTTTKTYTPLPSWDEFMVGARVGAAFRIVDMLSVWPRAGFSYNWWQNQSTTSATFAGTVGTLRTTNTVSQFGLDVDPQLVFSPWRHVGFTFGVTAGIPLASASTGRSVANYGSTTVDTHNSTAANNWYVGANLGLLAYF